MTQPKKPTENFYVLWRQGAALTNDDQYMQTSRGGEIVKSSWYAIRTRYEKETLTVAMHPGDVLIEYSEVARESMRMEKL